jgi:hypothetical protein
VEGLEGQDLEDEQVECSLKKIRGGHGARTDIL